MTERSPTTPAAPPRRVPRARRRLKRAAAIAGAVVLALLLLGAAAAWHLTRPERLTPRIVSAIEKATSARVTLDRAEARWARGEVVLTGLRVALPPAARDAAPPGAADAMAELFTAERARIALDPVALLRGEAPMRELLLHAPTLHVIRHEEQGVTNIELLQRARDESGPPPEPPRSLPRIRIDRGDLRRAEVRGGERREIGRAALDGTLSPAADREGVYRFDFTAHPDAPPDDTPPVRLTGELDLDRFACALELKDLPLESVPRSLLPAPLRSVWQATRPRGVLPLVRLRIAPSDAEGEPPSVELDTQLRDLAVTLPIDPLYATPMRDVSGEIHLENDRLEVHDLRGLVEGVRYRLDGWLDAAQPAHRFDLAVTTDRFEIPRTPRIVPALSPAVQRSYRRLSPSGAFRLRARVRRDGADRAVRYDGRVDVLGATARYERFPYPAEGLEGLIRFSNDELIIERLEGETAAGGRVEIVGRIAPPGEGARVEMTVKLRDVPIDDRLLAAMEPGHRQALEMLMHEPALQRLEDRGLIRPVAPGESLDPPPGRNGPPYRFRLGGLLDADVDVLRPLGDDADYFNTTTVYAEGLGGVFEYFPFPVVGQSGKVSFNREAVVVHDVTARAPDGSTVRATGRITGHGEDDGPITPDLRLFDARGRVSELLLQAIPEEQARQIRRLRLTGDVAAEARIFRDPQRNGIAFTVEGNLADGRADPLGSGLIFEPVAGRITVNNDGFDLADITAACGEGELAVRGRWRFTRSDPAPDGGDRNAQRRKATDVRVRLVGERLPIDRRFAELVPPDMPDAERIRGRLEALDLDAVTGFTLDAARPAERGEARPFEFDLTVQPHRAAFTFDEQRFTLENMAGSARYHRAELQLDALAGDAPEGRLALDGVVDLRGDAGAALSVDADLDRIGDTVRAVLPRQAIEAIDALRLDGGVATTGARLRVTPPDSSEEDRSKPDAGQRAASPSLGRAFRPDAAYEFEAELRLDEVSAEPGVRVDGVNGAASLRVSSRPGFPSLSLSVDADRGRVLGRRFDRLALRLDNDRSPERLDLRLRGAAAGGVAVGRGEVHVGGASPGYRVRIDLLEADLDPLMHPEDFAEAPATTPAVLAVRRVERGVATASLTVDGSLEDSGRRRGRGSIAIRNAALFDAPLGMAVLQSVNLAVPDSRAFDRVACRWTLDGQRVTIDELSFETPSFAVTGSGYMALPSTRLDLQMVTRVTGRAGLGKLGEAFNLLKDELIDIRITGTLDDPRTRVVSFQGLRNTWLRLFGFEARRGAKPPPVAPQR